VRFSLKNLKKDNNLINIPMFLADHLDKFIPYLNQDYNIIIGSIAVRGHKVASGSEPFWRRMCQAS